MKTDTLYELCDTISEELEEANEKIRQAGRKMSAGDVDYLDKLTHTLKSIKTTIAMIEADEDGYSGRYYRDGESMNGGGMSNATRVRGYMRGNSRNYSRDDARMDFMEDVRELMRKAPDDSTRKKLERFVAEIK